MTISICTDCHLAANGYDTHETWADGHFSWHPCQGCGSTLGGIRFDYAILEPANR